jgi:hypothetical protein
MEARRIRLQGERGISCKAIAQGMPACSGCTCMLVCASLRIHCTRDRGCQPAPGIPCTLRSRRRGQVHANLGRSVPRERETVSTVIASEAKQSISRLAETWIASLRSQRRGMGRGVLDTPHVWGRARRWRGARSFEPVAQTGLTDASHAQVKGRFRVQIDND